MFISRQGYEGLQMAVLSIKEIYKFLLEHGVPSIFSERFSQDDLQNYFDRKLDIGRRCDDPTVRDFNTIKLQYSVRQIAENV